MNWWIFCVLWYLSKAKGEPPSISSASVEASTLKKEQANFAFNLLQKTGLEKSTVISPVSISVALGMVLYGANGNTAKEIQEAIAKGVSEEEIHKHLSLVSNYIKENEGSIKMANKAYFSKGLSLLESYKNGIEEFYNGSFQLTDFTDSQTTSDEINTFVSEITDNEIQKIVSPEMLDEFSRLILVNAICFEKQWAMKFRLLPNKALFHSSPISSKEITMMEKFGYFSYIKTKQFKLVKIEYASNDPNWRYGYYEEDFNMFIILPHKEFGLAEVIQNIDIYEFLKMMSSQGATQGKITIPLFNAESTFNLNDILKELNIKDAFDAQKADFSGITLDKNIFASDILNKAYIKVNESGAKFGPRNIVKHYYLSYREVPTFEFFADHPFLYLIADKKNNIYFIGTFFN